jgi:hypothetical protein
MGPMRQFELLDDLSSGRSASCLIPAHPVGSFGRKRRMTPLPRGNFRGSAIQSKPWYGAARCSLPEGRLWLVHPCSLS